MNRAYILMDINTFRKKLEKEEGLIVDREVLVLAIRDVLRSYATSFALFEYEKQREIFLKILEKYLDRDG